MKFSDRKTDMVQFRVPREKHELMDRIQVIAKREGENVNDVIIRALDEYDEKHWKGNYQTLMESFEEGGVKSNGQFQQEIIRQLEHRKSTYWKEIIRILKQKGIKPKKRVEMGREIAKALKDKEVEVIF